MKKITIDKNVTTLEFVENKEALEVSNECWLVSCSGKVSYYGKNLFKNKEDAEKYYKRILNNEGVTKDEVLLFKCKLEENI